MSGKCEIVVHGEYMLPMDCDQVWHNLNSPAILQQCIRGCDAVTRDSEGDFHAHFSFRAGPFRKRLSARLQVELINPPRCYRLSAQIDAKALGGASGGSTVSLHQVGAQTTLEYNASIVLWGWFAGLGGDWIKAATERYMQTFFSRFVDLSMAQRGMAQEVVVEPALGLLSED